MGTASPLFFSSGNSEKQTLHRRITPSVEQFEEQKERWNDLAEHLKADLRKRSGCVMRTWLQGSYKFGTQVRPTRSGDEFDIDLGIYFEWAGRAEDGDYAPEELKRMAQLSLYDYQGNGVEEIVSPPKPRCSRIRFEGDFHIDVPVYHIDPARDARRLATEKNGWEDSDPKAQYLWFVNRFDENLRARARRQVRYLKTWAGLQFPNASDRPSSTLLTVLVADAMDELSKEELEADDVTLACVVEKVTERLEQERVVKNPAGDCGEDLAERMDEEAFEAFLEKLQSFQSIAESALECNDIASAADKWSEAFEHFFPMPDAEEVQKAEEGKGGLPIKIVFPEVEVQATAKRNEHLQWRGRNAIGPIPKGCKIQFRVVNPFNIPDGSSIEWMVRNEGSEAEYTNDLGHKAGYGVTAKEDSAYSGTHYMDCVVKNHGVLVGMRRIPVTISGQSVPERNPKRRPAWAGLRNRK